ncbi:MULTISPECIES: DUF309 domain-containing protein [Brevibacillus]|uniref:DUF309 domain-containing protein n=1 Tax=Brevibacillus TaxID=55080 RepID=UPI00203C9768|nr:MULTISPECIES: DUF309 domain-containing protein [Brevibacillus]MCM3079926.1 DUF309 domain-containing protein [Brevibacillus invocatus]MCM3430119.1 DUF309 domain-containing protein [Brevibacillus invocatus]MDH4616675.1 DUF309 domain-containing protein [Brevibacillus sp. AY1]
MYPQPYLDYLVLFHAERDYFECHEILEEYWKSAPPAERKLIWVGLIQIAVGLYHQRRGNQAGALKMIGNAVKLVRQHQSELQELGLDAPALIARLEKRLDDLNKGIPYVSLDLPMIAPDLLEAYKQACISQNLTPYRPSDMANSYLLNKHTLRDRQDVIEERMRQLKHRQAQRNSQAT